MPGQPARAGDIFASTTVFLSENKLIRRIVVARQRFCTTLARAPVLVAFLVAACGGSGGDDGNAQTGEGWLIPTGNVADGGPGKDGIPALEQPTFAPASFVTLVEPDDLVIVVRDGDQIKAYPEDIMDYHEIVNDGPSNAPFIVSYCPLTASAIGWRGRATDANPTFGVSGLLYNSNLLLYDRQTDTHWSQMLQLAVNGSRIGQRPETVQVLETKFATLVSMYPDAVVMTRNTGHFRDYDQYPYGSYRQSPFLLFQTAPFDNRLHPKERALGIHTDSAAKVYQIAGFGDSTQVINEQFNGQSIVVIGNSALDFAAIYSRELSDGTILSLNPVPDDLPNVMIDSEGNVWDVFGTAVSGPRTGEQLASVRAYTAMWFAWATHFGDVEIHFN